MHLKIVSLTILYNKVIKSYYFNICIKYLYEDLVISSGRNDDVVLTGVIFL